MIESQINEAHVRIYRPGKETSTPAGQGGAVTMTVEVGREVARQRRRAEGAERRHHHVREVLSLGADGKTLTMAVTTRRRRKGVEHA